MKKTIIGAIVGGIILFLWQFLSWTMLNRHDARQRYTPKQDSIMAYLNTQFSEDGGYMMPRFAPGTSNEEMEKQMKAIEGKPWAEVVYHKSMPGMDKMFMNMGRSLVVNIFIIWLLCWLLTKINAPSFGTVFGHIRHRNY
ncbi:MAG: hypothetical protein IPO01_07365 [Chitinophagaceae bacterium]|nr:hypothetical protein [Chitinophagaceae bacterium]